MPATSARERMIRPLFHQSEQDLERGRWIVDAADREFISELLPALDALAHQGADHSTADPGSLVRDAVADLASCSARATGRLAWLLVGVGSALEPLLYGLRLTDASALVSGKRLADAECVLLRLRTRLRWARAHQVAHP